MLTSRTQLSDYNFNRCSGVDEHHHRIKILIWEESRHGVKFASEAYKTYVVQNCTDYFGFRLWILRETMEIVLGNVNGNPLNFMVVYWLDKTMPMVEMRCAWWK